MENEPGKPEIVVFAGIGKKPPLPPACRPPCQLTCCAGLMLVPIYLGLCRAADLNRGHEAAGVLINANLGMAVLVSVVHSVTMIAAGGILAWLVYRYLGLKFVSRSWFNLDATWAFSLILVGALSFVISRASKQ